MRLPARFFIFINILLFNLSSHTCRITEASFNPIDYVNEYRIHAGLPLFTKNPLLQKAAENHSKYRSLYNTGHYERRGDRGFTGKTPSQRAVYAGYSLCSASENIAEAPTPMNGVENLMTAIYHRFGFLSFNVNEIGMGSVKKRKKNNSIYTYVMGNSLLSRECQRSTYNNESPFYKKMCKNSKQKVAVSKKNALDTKLTSKSKDFVIYPYANAKNIPPAFYEEYPDPLPQYSMVGNPLSIEFHPVFKKQRIQILKVTLQEAKNKKFINLMPLYHKNDPHKKLSTTQFAFFPMTRLDWGKVYHATLRFKIGDNVSEEIQWSFKTKKMPNILLIDKQHTEFKLKKNRTYTLYYQSGVRSSKTPRSVHARFGYSYPKGRSVGHEIVDSMTVKVCLHGKKGDQFKVKNPSHPMGVDVKLIIE